MGVILTLTLIDLRAKDPPFQIRQPLQDIHVGGVRNRLLTVGVGTHRGAHLNLPIQLINLGPQALILVVQAVKLLVVGVVILDNIVQEGIDISLIIALTNVLFLKLFMQDILRCKLNVIQLKHPFKLYVTQ